jgi:hypothetical protein
MSWCLSMNTGDIPRDETGYTVDEEQMIDPAKVEEGRECEGLQILRMIAVQMKS